MASCGHPLCDLIGDECSLATGVSRGCRTGPRTAPPFEAEVIDEVSALLEALAQPSAEAATRLAFVFRREARRDRNLLVLAADELEPALAARLDALCRRRG